VNDRDLAEPTFARAHSGEQGAPIAARSAQICAKSQVDIPVSGECWAEAVIPACRDSQPQAGLGGSAGPLFGFR